MIVMTIFSVFLAAGFRVMEMQKRDYLVYIVGGSLISLIGVADVIIGLFMAKRDDKEMQRKRLQKRK